MGEMSIRKTQFNKKFFAKQAAFLFASICFVLLFSASTSPLYPKYYMDDSAIFQAIGKLWTKGVIPYVGAFDHKGPYIFFVDALGYATAGVWVIQAINLFFTLNGIYAITDVYGCSERKKYVLTFASLFILLQYYNAGNLCEEYCMPFLAFSTAYFLKDIKSDGDEHDPRHAILYGVSFGICFLTRVTNSALLCAFVLAIIVKLIKRRKWMNLLKNAGCFIIGAAIAVLPFIIYFAANGALYEMFYGTILYNIEYSGSMSSQYSLFNGSTPKELVAVALKYGILLLLLITGIRKMIKRQKLGLAFVLCAFFGGYVCLSGQHYINYAMILTPMYPAYILEITQDSEDGVPVRFRRVCTAGFAVWTAVMGIYILSVYFSTWMLPEIKNELVDDRILPTELLDQIPEDERDSFVGYNIHCNTYYEWDISPRYEYFHHQEWQGLKSDSLKEKILERFSSLEAKWILAPDSDKTMIADILNEHYAVVYSLDVRGTIYNVWRLSPGASD